MDLLAYINSVIAWFKLTHQEPESTEDPEPEPSVQKPAVERVDFDPVHYYREAHPKNQIVIHHTASGKTGDLSGAAGDINWWKQDGKRIATAYIIAYDGRIFELFNPEYWGHHLGMRHPNNRDLNKSSIAIEIDSWGPLSFDGSAYKSWTKKIVPPIRVTQYPSKFRGHEYYEMYTDDQLKSLSALLLWLSEEFNIPLDYREDMWDISTSAIEGRAGVYTHVSYRSDKSDCHPQPGLLTILKTLKQ